MVWSRLRRRRTAPRLPLPGPCRHGRHTLRTERLLLYTPETTLDLVAAAAAASDPEAQRWLGWGDHVVADAGVREAVLRLLPGDTETLRRSRSLRNLLDQPYEPVSGEEEFLVGVRLDDGRYAGFTGVHADTGEIGGWLAPEARGLGLGTELFRAAAVLGHAHLGLRTVRAGHEPANTASGRALARAGFVAADGPPRHTLPNGREIDARWLERTTTAPPTRCHGAAPLPA
ncbi:GNAT family N-acetyltransferase [Streptomyces sp. NPDC001714]|uniref:GNAT family N-acetyltransferase n=1 Tax=Streptomyces sp. NPDC001714 TaxID=3364603 RepID=UPI0036B204A9